MSGFGASRAGFVGRVVVVAAALLAAASGAEADKVDVRASTREESGRLTFIWPRPVDFDARSADGRFILRFERPAHGDFSGAVASLRRFLGTPSVTDGGRALAFPLKPNVTALTFADKRRVVVDLFSGIAPPASEAAVQKAASEDKPAGLPVVEVRRGEHQGFSRIVFDWTAPVGYVVEKRGESLFLTFDQKAALDLAALDSKPLRYISGVRAALGDITTDVAMAVADTSKVRDFRQDDMIAIDVYAPSPEQPQVDAAPKSGTIAMWPVPAPNRLAKVAAAPKPLLGEIDLPPAAARPGSDGPPIAESGGEAIGELRFDWNEPVAAAVFRRAGALWIVFDRPSIQDLDALRAAAGDGLDVIEQRPHPRATVLRLGTTGEQTPEVRRDGLAWIVGFAPGSAKAVAIEPTPKGEAGGQASLVLPVAEPGAPLAMTDPAIGDPLVVVPVVPLGHGVAHDYRYPQARLLASTQGIVIRPLVDNLGVRSGREEVALTTPGGFGATAVPEATLARSRLASAGTIERLLDLAPWGDAPVAAFTQTRQRLEATVIAAEDDATRAHGLLRLASFNLAHGFAAETLGAVAQAALARPEIEDDARFRLLRGAALMMMGRLGEAALDLDHPSLVASPEAAAWRTALRVARGDTAAKPADLASEVALVTGYPRVLRKALLGPLAQAAIDGGSPALAGKLVALLAAEAETPAERAEATVLAGRELAANGDIPGALAKWGEVEADTAADRRSRARAVDARVALALRENKMDPAAAVAELERLDFAWRGDNLELAILRRLGDLYLAGGEFPKALRTLRRVATNYPDAPDAADITGKLTQAFEAVLVGEKAAALSPLSAVALYDEFRELTPPGARGDALIGAVADRMIELDLLGRAAALLETQVRYRLSGTERAQAGARLARLYLLDAKPAAALEALTLSGKTEMPKPLAIERRYVEARALARLGRPNDALEPVEALDTPEAATIRADIFWAMDDWGRAAKSLASILDHRGDATEAGGAVKAQARAETANDALHLAVAMALAGDEVGLRELKATYGVLMAQSRWRDVFPLIVANGMPTANLQALARDIGPIDSFREFLSRPAARPAQ